MGIFVALIALSFLILVHELGHFVAAKSLGIKVLEFSMFMGPKLLSFKKGETVYSLRLIPMGGFVKMEGEEESSDDPRAFHRQKIWKRAIVIAAGAFMNIVTAFILASIVIGSYGFYTNKVTDFDEGSPLQAAGMEPGDKLISYDGKTLFDPYMDITTYMYGEKGTPKEIVYFDASQNKKVTKTISAMKTQTVYRLGFTPTLENNAGTNVIQELELDSPLKKAGVKNGDKITTVDGITVANRDEIAKVLNELRPDKDAPLTITVERDGKPLTFENIKPFPYSQYTLGQLFEHKKGNFTQVLGASFNYSVSTVRNVITTLGWLFSGNISFKELSGPVGIIGSVGNVVEVKQPVSDTILNLFYISALISINLGVMNLLPFPALDGSILLLLLIEKLRGKPIPQEKIGMISMVGFLLLICVLIATLFNDIPRFFL